MPTRGNAFDFEDNPSESDDKLPPISRRLKKPTTVAAIVAMTGKPTSALANKNERIQRVTGRNRTRLAQASETESPNSKDELSEAAKKREKENQARDARKQKLDDRSAHRQLADDFAESCTDDVLVDRLLRRTPGGEAHGPWDGNMMRLEVDGDGNCLIHAMLRCSDYDPDVDEDVYKAKVSNLRKEIHTYLVQNADLTEFTKGCDYQIQRGRKLVEVDTYSKYCK